MVDILPRPKTGADRFALAFGGLGQSLAKDIPEHFLQKKESAALEGLLGKEFAGIRDPELRKIAVKTALEGKVSSAELETKQKFLTELFSGGLGSSKGNKLAGSGENTDSSESKGFSPLDISDEDIARASVVSPEMARSLQHSKDVALREKRENKANEFAIEKEDRRRQEFGHNETSKYAEKVSEKGENAREVLGAVSEARKALKSGKTGPGARTALFKYFSSRKSPFSGIFQTEEGQTLVNVAKTLAGGGVKELFSKPTEREFFWFENILPDLFKTEEVNEKSLQYFEKIAKFNLKRQEVAADITRKNKGIRPIDVEDQVNTVMQKEGDKLVDEGYKQAGLTPVRTPDGDIVAVPNNKLQEALKHGGEIVK